MFTGIIEATGQVLAAKPSPHGLRLSVALGPIARGVKTGDSIAIDGCCLTVARLAGRTAHFDLIPETLRRTTFQAIRPGARVNLERAARIGGRLDGHIVQGHVDALATVLHVTPAADGERKWTLKLPPAFHAQLVPKGSIALDGISLTIAELTATTVTVAIIPETLRRTTLGSKLPGAKLHVELDVLGKFVHRYLAQLALAPARPRKTAAARKRRRSAR